MTTGIKDASKLIAGRSRGSRTDNRTDTSTGESSLASRLRMQWWRDSVAEMYEDFRPPRESTLPPLASSRKQNPTLRSLNHAIHSHGLTHRFLQRIIEARESDLDVTQQKSVREVAQYGEDVFSSILYLSLECVGVSHALYVVITTWHYFVANIE